MGRGCRQRGAEPFTLRHEEVADVVRDCHGWRRHVIGPPILRIVPDEGDASLGREY